MTGLTMRSVREAVISFLDYSDLLAEDEDAEAYAESAYDMDGLCDAMYAACKERGVSPDKLDDDVFVGLMERYDKSQV